MRNSNWAGFTTAVALSMVDGGKACTGTSFSKLSSRFRGSASSGIGLDFFRIDSSSASIFLFLVTLLAVLLTPLLGFWDFDREASSLRRSERTSAMLKRVAGPRDTGGKSRTRHLRDVDE